MYKNTQMSYDIEKSAPGCRIWSTFPTPQSTGRAAVFHRPPRNIGTWVTIICRTFSLHTDHPNETMCTKFIFFYSLNLWLDREVSSCFVEHLSSHSHLIWLILFVDVFVNIHLKQTCVLGVPACKTA